MNEIKTYLASASVSGIPIVTKAESVDSLLNKGYTTIQPLTLDCIAKDKKTFSFKGWKGEFEYVKNSHGCVIARVTAQDGKKWYSYTGWDIDAGEFARMFLEA